LFELRNDFANSCATSYISEEIVWRTKSVFLFYREYPLDQKKGISIDRLHSFMFGSLFSKSFPQKP